MKQAHFYAYGVIGENDPLFKVFTGEADPIISSQKVVDFLSQNGDADEIIVHINSRGGSVDEGFAIHDLFANSGKKITTRVEGQASSIASVIFLAGSVRQVTENSSVMIHNPWIDPTLISGLEADDLEKMTADMRHEENRILDFYVAKTGADRDQIKEFMKAETKFDPAKALELKFATEILKPIQAFAYKRNNNKNNDSVMNAILKKMDEVYNYVTGKTKVLNIEATAEAFKTAQGATINIDGGVKIGASVSDAEGKPTPNASYTLENGTAISTDADSKISNVKEASEASAETTETTEVTLSPEIVALNEKIAEMEAAALAKDAEIKALQDTQAAMTEKFVAIAKNIKSTHVVNTGTAAFTREKKNESVKENRAKDLKDKLKKEREAKALQTA